MTTPIVSDDEFVSLWMKHLSPIRMAKELGVDIRAIYNRRANIEKRRGEILPVTDKRTNRPAMLTMPENGKRATLDIEAGIVIVGSDAHYWPGVVSTGHRALIEAIKGLRPAGVVLNGDSFDGANAGRHARIGWSKSPGVAKELEAVCDRTNEIVEVSGDADKIHTLGNHDLRFDTKLSAMVPEFEGVPGLSLKEQLPEWKFCMSVMVNGNTIIKHRYHNGIHATYNNTVKAGINIITGHLHRLNTTCYGDYRGRRYGVDTGTLAAPDGAQFEYAEDNPSPHGSGFAVLTFYKGQLLHPELAEVIDEDAGLFTFRGQVISV